MQDRNMVRQRRERNSSSCSNSWKLSLQTHAELDKMGTADARRRLSAPIGSVAVVTGGKGSNFSQVLRPNVRRAFHRRSWTAGARRSLSEPRIILAALGFIPPAGPTHRLRKSRRGLQVVLLALVLSTACTVTQPDAVSNETRTETVSGMQVADPQDRGPAGFFEKIDAVKSERPRLLAKYALISRSIKRGVGYSREPQC